MREVDGGPKYFKEHGDSLAVKARELERQKIIALGIRGFCIE